MTSYHSDDGEFEDDIMQGLGTITVPEDFEGWSEVKYYIGVWTNNVLKDGYLYFKDVFRP